VSAPAPFRAAAATVEPTTGPALAEVRFARYGQDDPPIWSPRSTIIPTTTTRSIAVTAVLTYSSAQTLASPCVRFPTNAGIASAWGPPFRKSSVQPLAE
jgi:hypothetical protein